MASFVIRSAVPARDALFWLTCRLPARGSARTVGARVPDKRRFPCCGSRGGRRHHPHPGRGAGARHGRPARTLARSAHAWLRQARPKTPWSEARCRACRRLPSPVIFPVLTGVSCDPFGGSLSPRAVLCRPVGYQDSCQPISARTAEKRSNTTCLTLTIEAECAPGPQFGAPSPIASRRVPPRSV